MTTPPTPASENAAAAASYREAARSSVRLAALAFRPLRTSGAVLRALRGELYHQRGVRDVMDVTAERVAVAGCAAAGGATRLVFHPASGAAGGDAAGDRWKLCLLSPAVLAAADVEGVPLGATAPTASFVIGAGGASTDAVRAELRDAEARGVVGARASSLVMRVHERVAEAARTTAGAVEGRRAAACVPTEVVLTVREVELTYRNYTMAELLSMVLPTGAADGGVVALSGFEQVGHIAHVNLSAAHLPYAGVIGQVVLDCNDTVDVVVNKVDAISSVFREFKMDVIAVRGGGGGGDGEELRDRLLTATVRQHGCVFRVPYHRVYWNSRLSFEHTRLVDQMRAGDVLFDVMAGVGPFAVPAAVKGVTVVANDLNPAAAEFMRVNAELNRVPAAQLQVCNEDGRDFLCRAVFDSVVGCGAGALRCAGRRHVTMNLPAIAVEFLDVFQPECARGGKAAAWKRWCHLPTGADTAAIDRRVLFHVYCFSAAGDVCADAVAQVEVNLGYALPERNREAVVMVRDVAPTKRMVCVSFTLPDAFWEHLVSSSVGDAEPLPKRPKGE